MPRLMAFLFCLGTFLPRQTCAQSQSSGEELIRVQEGDSCLDASRLSRLVRGHLGETPIPPSLSVDVFDSDPEPSATEGAGFFLLREGEIVAERRFDSIPDACDARHATFAVVIALAIENAVVSGSFEKSVEREQDSTTPQVKATEVEQTKEAADVERARAPEPSESSTEVQEETFDSTNSTELESSHLVTKDGPGVRFSAGGGLIARVIPEPALFASVGVATFIGHRLTIGADFITSETATTHFDEPPGRGDLILAKGNSRLTGGRALLCWEPLWGDGSVGICGGAAGGQAEIDGDGGQSPTGGAPTRLPWAAAVMRGGLRYPARGPGGLHLAGDIYGNFLRPGLELTGPGDEERARDAGPVAAGAFIEMFVVLE